MTTILTREQEVVTAWGGFQLNYELLMSHFSQDEGDGDFFGIRIKQYKNKEKCLVEDSAVPGLTESFEEAEGLFFQFVRETVMPVHLYELIDDWQSAFHPRMRRLFSQDGEPGRVDRF